VFYIHATLKYCFLMCRVILLELEKLLVLMLKRNGISLFIVDKEAEGSKTKESSFDGDPS
jgi:hypothetical protein